MLRTSHRELGGERVERIVRRGADGLRPRAVYAHLLDNGRELLLGERVAAKEDLAEHVQKRECLRVGNERWSE